MNQILSIATSGLLAAEKRLAASAQNVANAAAGSAAAAGNASANAASEDAQSAPLRVDQVEISGGGTQARIGYAPPMPEGGEIDLAAEAVDQLSSMLAFAANLAVLQAYDEMTEALLDVTA